MRGGRRVVGSRLGWVLLVLLAGGCGGPPAERRVETKLYDNHPDLAGRDTTPLRGRRILIDPGHGGRFGGSEGVEKTREADVNLGVGLYLWGLLREAGADVYLTRASDRDLLPAGSDAVRDDLAARVAAIDSLRPDVFLSLHHNSNAALDRERNAIETYYKLGDDGPSFDLGRAIHSQLGSHLGIETAKLLPGNYFVLRGAHTAAVLGEASYLSNPKVETKLQLADKQRLEAEAYFLGLLDYFVHGAAAIDKRVPAGDTLRTGEVPRFAIGEPVDPLSVQALADGVPQPCRLEAATGDIVIDATLEPGPRDWNVSARLARGNAARPWIGRLVVAAPPARAVWVQQPAAVRPGSRMRVQAMLQDASGRPIGDGTAVQWSGTNLELLQAETTTFAGTALAFVQARAGARLALRCAGFDANYEPRLDPAASAARWARCVDARDGRPIASAWSGGSERSDRLGCVQLDPGRDSLRIESRGYLPWLGRLPADSTLRLAPQDGGLLHGVRFALDPGGQGGDPSPPGGGVAAADLAYEICRFLSERLAAGGATAALVRDRATGTSDLERIRVALEQRADWYVRLDLAPQAPAMVLHYPGSAGGERLATAIAASLARRLGFAVPVRSDTRFVLQQTPCPAVVVQLPVASTTSVAAERTGAAAIATGIRVGLDAKLAQRPPILGTVAGGAAFASLVLLDGAEIAPVNAAGAFRFDAVGPGSHLVSAVRIPPSEVRVEVSGNDTTRVHLGAPPP